MTDGTNRAFNENIANRLWAMMMGRGLVHPVDLRHPDNPPSQPELLKMLGDEIAAVKFDVKAFLRELALTHAYQRTIDLPAETAPVPDQIAARLAELKTRSEPLEAAAERARDDYRSAVKAWHQAEDALIPLVAEQEKAVAQHPAASKKKEDAHKAVERRSGPDGRWPRYREGARRSRRTGSGGRQEAAEGEGRWRTPLKSSSSAPRPPRPNWRHSRKRSSRNPPH